MGILRFVYNLTERFNGEFENNSLPKYSPVSCSHNKDKDWRQATAKVLKKFMQDVKKKRACKSVNFRRWKETEDEIDYVDENKMLMRLYGNVPVCVPTIISNVALDRTVPVVGSGEVGIVEGKLEEFLADKGVKPRLSYVDEGDDLSLANSIGKLVQATGLKENETFVFDVGDCPFSFLTLDQAFDSDFKKYGLIMNVNTRSATLHKGESLFDRNFYQVMVDYHNQRRDMKEPNKYGFSKQFMDLCEKLLNNFYNNRQGGGLMTALMALEPEWRKLPVIALPRVAKLAATVVSNKLLRTNLKYKAEYWEIEKIATWLLKVPVRLKATHSNPFLVRDIDAWHDLWFYQDIVKHVKGTTEYDGLDRIHPYGHLIYEFNKYMHDVKDKIGVLNPDYEKRRFTELIHRAKGKYRKILKDTYEQRDVQGNVELAVDCLESHVAEYNRQIEKMDLKNHEIMKLR